MSAIKKLIIGAIGIMISLSLIPFLKAGALGSNLYRIICQIRGSLNSLLSMVITELTYRLKVDHVERLDGRYPYKLGNCIVRHSSESRDYRMGMNTTIATINKVVCHWSNLMDIARQIRGKLKREIVMLIAELNQRMNLGNCGETRRRVSYRIG